MTDDQSTDGLSETDGVSNDEGPPGADDVPEGGETALGDDTGPDVDGSPDETAGQTRDSEVTYDPTEAPLADLAASVSDRKREGDPSADPEADELFDQHSVSEIDSDRLWERLEEDAPSPTALLEDDRDEREIDAHRYCKQCEHFSSPPDVGCELEGTDILDLTDLGTFRVVDCPVVIEDEALEREY